MSVNAVLNSYWPLLRRVDGKLKPEQKLVAQARRESTSAKTTANSAGGIGTSRDQPDRNDLDLLTEVRTQCERAIIVQLLVTSPAHGIAHSLYFNLSSQVQSFPIGDVWKHELCLPNLAR